MASSSPNFRGENKRYLKSPPSHYLQGFLWIPGGCLGFFPSTIWWGRIGVSLEGGCNLLLGGWTNPISKNMFVKLYHLHINQDENTQKNWNHHHKSAVVTVAGWGVDPMGASPFTICHGIVSLTRIVFSQHLGTAHYTLAMSALEKGILRCPCWNCQGCKN